MSEPEPSTVEVLAAFEPFADDGGECLWALTGTGWHRIAQCRAARRPHRTAPRSAAVHHRDPAAAQRHRRNRLTGLRMLAWNTTDHRDPNRRIIEAADTRRRHLHPHPPRQRPGHHHRPGHHRTAPSRHWPPWPCSPVFGPPPNPSRTGDAARCTPTGRCSHGSSPTPPTFFRQA